jgi:superkiller protein 3
MVLPKEGKLGQRIKVETWARGLVILKYPFELAWKIVVEWKDCESIGARSLCHDCSIILISLGDHDVNLLREYIRFFPENGLTLTLKAYLDSPLSPFPVEIDNPEDSEGDRKDANESDIADTILDEMIVNIIPKFR